MFSVTNFGKVKSSGLNCVYTVFWATWFDLKVIGNHNNTGSGRNDKHPTSYYSYFPLAPQNFNSLTNWWHPRRYQQIQLILAESICLPYISIKKMPASMVPHLIVLSGKGSDHRNGSCRWRSQNNNLAQNEIWREKPKQNIFLHEYWGGWRSLLACWNKPCLEVRILLVDQSGWLLFSLIFWVTRSLLRLV